MAVDKQTLLAELPPYLDQWIKIMDKQKVNDIVIHVLSVHKKYAAFYDRIALYFDAPTIDKICNKLYTFCKKNIEYEEEPEEVQTNGLPTGFLERGIGDCKHMATFCGGILDALNRLTDQKIKWFYRFASYNFLVKTPHHVFVVVVDDNNEEIWIDPVPGANAKTPDWILDKTIKASTMALYENIAGIREDGVGFYQTTNNTIGKASLTLTPKVDGDNNINWDGSNKYAGVFNPYLGLSMYRDLGGDRNLNKDQIATELNAMIQKGPHPGHTITPDFVEWIYNTSTRSWNFYFPDGVRQGFTAKDLLPPGYPRLITTADGRLTLDSDQKIDDYRNAEIHLLTAWAQDIINDYDPTPYPVKPEHLKIHSQMKEGNIETRNLFTEARGDSVFKEVAKGLEKALNFVKAGWLKIVGSIPRNAFLGLVAINAFNMAKAMSNRIDAGNWEEMAAKWRKIGGNPDKLLGTINDGKGKKAILGNSNAIGEPITVGALLTAAAPIIAIMIKFIDKDGKITEVLSATKGFLQTNYPDIDLDAFGFLDKRTGKELDYYVDDIDDENKGGGNNNLPAPTSNTDVMQWLKTNPIPAAGIVGLGAFLVTKKKGGKPNLIIPIIAAGVTYFMLNKSSGGSTTDKRAAIINWAMSGGDTATTKERVKAIFMSMPESEVNTVYDFMFNYALKNIPLPESSNLYSQMQIISSKYNLFT